MYNILKFYRVSGTFGDYTYYNRRGTYCRRKRTSLNKERILSDPAFKNFRNCSTQFGQASRIATSIYKQLPKKKRKDGVIGKLTGEIYKLIRSGLSKKKILCKIISQYFGIVMKKKEKNGSITYNTLNVEEKLQEKLLAFYSKLKDHDPNSFHYLPSFLANLSTS